MPSENISITINETVENVVFNVTEVVEEITIIVKEFSISTLLSEDVGNNAVLGTDGGIFVPTPVISYPVTSVNTKTGAVVLDAGDIGETSTRFWLTDALKSAYDGVVSGFNNLATTGQRLITSDEITKLSNTSGTNSGDETTASIQTKRPLKTIDNQSIEGVGNLTINRCVFVVADIYSVTLTGSLLETIMNSPTLIPISFLERGIMDIKASGNRTVVTAGGTNVRLYINSSHSLVGATEIAIYNPLTASSSRNLYIERDIVFSSTQMSMPNSISTQTNAGQTSNQRNQNFNYILKNNPYIIVTYTNGQNDMTSVFEKLRIIIYN